MDDLYSCQFGSGCLSSSHSSFKRAGAARLDLFDPLEHANARPLLAVLGPDGFENQAVARKLERSLFVAADEEAVQVALSMVNHDPPGGIDAVGAKVSRVGIKERFLLLWRHSVRIARGHLRMRLLHNLYRHVPCRVVNKKPLRLDAIRKDCGTCGRSVLVR